jgi:hypothetical protein
LPASRLISFWQENKNTKVTRVMRIRCIDS